MYTFNYYFNVFELPLVVFSFTKNLFQFLTLITKNICKYESFLIYHKERERQKDAERETFKENFIAVNKTIPKIIIYNTHIPH